MNKQQRLTKAYHDFINNEDLDEANEAIRAEVKTLEDLRFIIAVARQHGEEVEDVIETLISL